MLADTLRKLRIGVNGSLLATIFCSAAGSIPIPAVAQQADLPTDLSPLEEFQEDVRLTGAGEGDPSALTQERLEDLADFGRLPMLAKQIKPSCRSLLADEFRLPKMPVVRTLPAGLGPLWREALQRPEVELQLKAAEAIERASRLAIADLKDTVPLLIKLVDAPETDHVVCLAAARALLALDAREAAPILRRQAASDLEFAQIIEPSLMDWNDLPMQSSWLSRLEQGTAPTGLLILAMQASAKTGLRAAVPHLRRYVVDFRNPPPLRLEAAKALGQLADRVVLEEARSLTTTEQSRDMTFNHLAAAFLLVRQTDDDAVELLERLALDPEPAVAALAFKSLLQINPTLIVPVLEHAIQSSDPGLRKLTTQALFLLRSPETVQRLSGFLTDPNVWVRSAAQEQLIRSHAAEELRSSVHQSVEEMLSSDLPRGIAQAAIVVGQIDHEPAADRLVELLQHEAPDVSIAAAWALRRLAVPETAEPILRHLAAQTERSLVEIPIESNSDLSWTWTMYEQQKHLLEALGLMEFRAADPLLLQYVPAPLGKPLNHPFHWVHCTRRPELRARAIWALGRGQDEQRARELSPLFVGRLVDPDEINFVSAMSALSLGQLKADGTEQALREFYVPEATYTERSPRASVLAVACRKALESMTGQSLPPLQLEPSVIPETGWFLEPLSGGR